MKLPRYLNRRKVERLIQAGRDIANIAFNVKQFSHRPLDDYERKLLASSHKEWDTALRDFLGTGDKQQP